MQDNFYSLGINEYVTVDYYQQPEFKRHLFRYFASHYEERLNGLIKDGPYSNYHYYRNLSQIFKALGLTQLTMTYIEKALDELPDMKEEHKGIHKNLIDKNPDLRETLKKRCKIYFDLAWLWFCEGKYPTSLSYFQ